jgi:hypothetical protein
MPQSRNPERNGMIVPTPALGQIKGSDDDPSVFADQRTKTAWELLQAVKRISKEVPPEDQSFPVRTISFAPEQRSTGMYVLLFSGTLVGTEQPGTFVVPDRSLIFLDQLRIPYRTT